MEQRMAVVVPPPLFRGEVGVGCVFRSHLENTPPLNLPL